ncbi:MAG TPA: hypothetical protein VMW24_09975 [Sedimentisphaerales bacterium]|nr:hypothetical protein [Sedimentisphaerales bacterium]
MTETTTISVHVCDVCGEHATEEQGEFGYYVEGIVLAPCETCGILACRSCTDDGDCCERRATIECEGLPERVLLGQQGLFE